MSLSPTDLASLLCSRLCHDLLSPVGAMNNGLELLADETDPKMRQHCLDLLADSARISAHKLKFFRLAFGAAGGFGEMVDSNEPKQLIEALVGEKDRLSMQWNVAADSLPKPAVKILLNLALIGMDTLVRGGELTIAAEPSNNRVEIAVRASGARVVLDESIEKALTGALAEQDIGARTAAAHMTALIAAERNGAIQVAHDDQSVTIGAALDG
ncbi:MAG: histidine phosphotransferase family protein [Blastomonas sp.]